MRGGVVALGEIGLDEIAPVAGRNFWVKPLISWSNS